MSSSDCDWVNECWVYLVSWQGRGPTKVGIADNITLRLASLQSGNPNKLAVNFGFRFDSRDQALAIEQSVLLSLKGRRLIGEWLAATPLRLKEEVEEIARKKNWRFVPWGAPPPSKIALKRRGAEALAEYQRLRDL